MTLSIWPKNEKPRDKLLQQGAAALSNAELLAILFGNGTRGKDVLTLCRELLSHHATLHNLFNADFALLRQHGGIGQAKFCQIQACAELSRRYLAEPLTEPPQFIDSESVKRYLVAELRGLKHEVFSCLFFDTRQRLIRYETLFSGTLNLTVVHPRRIAKRALELNAASVILAHNHPSGEIKPSKADIKLTQCVNQALSLIEIHLIDHIIVGGAKTLSFSEHGLV